MKRRSFLSLAAILPTLIAAKASPADLTDDELIARGAVHSLYNSYNYGNWAEVERAFADTADFYFTPTMQFSSREELLSSLKKDWNAGKRFGLRESQIWFPSEGLVVALPNVLMQESMTKTVIIEWPELHLLRYEKRAVRAERTLFNRLLVLESI